MASISNDKNGHRRLLYFNKAGKRCTIRLGKMSAKAADTVKRRVEAIVGDQITGAQHGHDLSQWIAALEDGLYGKLADHGLVPPRESAQLGPFILNYINGRKDIKPNTKRNMEQARGYLLEKFPADRPMRDFTEGDAEDFRQHMIGKGRHDNTSRRAMGRARQFFKAAMRRGLIRSNPFDVEGLATQVKPNRSRYYFVGREDAAKVLDACPDNQWRLLFALARYGGLRVPSEAFALTWDDVLWDQDKIHIRSPKTEHHEGKESRIIPLFPELRPLLLAGWEEAEPGTKHVITRYRDTNANLRTQLHRIIKRAGLTPWPKSFQQCRSTRETELAEDYPIQVVCSWIGNTQSVAAAHYLQTTEDHYRRAAQKAAQNAAAMPESCGIDEPDENEGELVNAGISGKNRDGRDVPEYSDSKKYPRQESNL